MKIYFNHLLLPSEELSFDLDNRAFRYGDGLFETMVVKYGWLRMWKYHWERLNHGMAALRMQGVEPWSKNTLELEVLHLVEEMGLEQARIRLHVWREGGGLYTPPGRETAYLIRADPWAPPASLKKEVGLATSVKVMPSLWSRFKTHNALTYVLAGMERQERRLDDLILLDHLGNVAESTYSNVFWQKDNCWYTPDLASGCLHGVMRRHIIAELYRSGPERLQVGLFPLPHLMQADMLILTNASGITFVERLNGRPLPLISSVEVSGWLQNLQSV
ncbi:MAG TPA: aminotransferase IV [Cytophagales bacterium]|nr:aminotransferase IV [Cytophagales bacterium]HAA18032.1 aminotransferase IV [Cytophagales bacterium]HAP63060.1 aminotransferase IV [Cytophagales bacterium]